MSRDDAICNQWYWWRSQTDRNMQNVFCPAAQATDTNPDVPDFPDGCARAGDVMSCFRPETQKAWWNMDRAVRENYSCGEKRAAVYPPQYERAGIARLQKTNPPRVDGRCDSPPVADTVNAKRIAAPFMSPNTPRPGWAPTYEGYCGPCDKKYRVGSGALGTRYAGY